MSWQIEHLAVGPAPVRVGRLAPPQGPQRGTVLFIPGRGDSLELRATPALALAQRGWAVVMAEHHGQGGSGRLGRHPDAVHVADFDLHLEVQRTVLARLDGPVLVLGHSMGGLIGAELLAEQPARIRAAVFTSPMWRFRGPLSSSWVGTIARAVAALGWERDFAPGEGPFSARQCVWMRRGADGPDEGLSAFLRAHPTLVRGGSTWGWVGAAARMMERLWSRPFEAVRSPVLIVSCTRDDTVSLEAHDALARRLPHASQLTLDSAHDPFYAKLPVRDHLWAGLFAHLEAAHD